MQDIMIEVIGVDPPCPRCKQTEANAQKAALKLIEKGRKVIVAKIAATAKETVAKYGVITPPALAINGVVKIMGKVPDVGVIDRLLRDVL